MFLVARRVAQLSQLSHISSVATLAQAISCSNLRMFFLRHKLFWLCLVQVSTTQFCCFPLVLMARVDDVSDRPVPPSPVQLSSSNFGSPNGSALDLERAGSRLSTWEDKNQRDLLTTATFLAKRFQDRKLRPDAYPVSGRYHE